MSKKYQLTISKCDGGPIILQTQHKDVDHLKRVANEWYFGRRFRKDLRGRRARKGLTLASLNKFHDPDGYLQLFGADLWCARLDMMTDDPCGGKLIAMKIELIGG